MSVPPQDSVPRQGFLEKKNKDEEDLIQTRSNDGTDDDHIKRDGRSEGKQNFGPNSLFVAWNSSSWALWPI